MRERLIELLGDYLYSEQIADHLLENGVIVPPCKVGDEINGEIVCEILFSEMLDFEGNICRNTQAYTCDKVDTGKKIRVEHPITWEEAVKALKGGNER